MKSKWSMVHHIVLQAEHQFMSLSCSIDKEAIYAVPQPRCVDNSCVFILVVVFDFCGVICVY